MKRFRPAKVRLVEDAVTALSEGRIDCRGDLFIWSRPTHRDHMFALASDRGGIFPNFILREVKFRDISGFLEHVLEGIKKVERRGEVLGYPQDLSREEAVATVLIALAIEGGHPWHEGPNNPTKLVLTSRSGWGDWHPLVS